MTPALLLLVGLVYLGVAVGYVKQHRYGMALCFVAYALANVGLALDAWKR